MAPGVEVAGASSKAWGATCMAWHARKMKASKRDSRSSTIAVTKALLREAIWSCVLRFVQGNRPEFLLLIWLEVALASEYILSR